MKERKILLQLICKVLTLICAISLFSSCSKNDETAEIDEQQLFVLAEESMNAERYAEALQYYNKILEHSPMNEDALNGRISVYVELGENNSILRDIDQLIMIDPDNANYYALKGLWYSKQTNDNDAVHWLSIALEKCEDDGTRGCILSTRANSYACLEQNEKSRDDYLQAIAYGQTNAHIYYSLGLECCSLNDYKAANSNFYEALSRGIDDTNSVISVLACSYREMCQYDQADKYFAQFLQNVMRIDDQSIYDAAIVEYAFMLATCDDGHVRNPKRARELVESNIEETEPKRLVSYYDVLACVSAAEGNFEQAMEYEMLALKQCNDDEKQQAYRDRLAMFQNGQMYIDPCGDN